MEDFMILHVSYTDNITNIRTFAEVLIDTEDWPLLSEYNWYIGQYGVCYVTGRKKCDLTDLIGTYRAPVQMHRLIIGDKCCGKHVHHINGNGLDNRKRNLDVLTATEHMRIHHQNRTRNKPFKKPTYLTESEKRIIAKCDNLTCKEMATRWDICTATVSKINKTYR